MLKVLVAVDGSAQGRRAIETARRLQAEAKGAEALLINVRRWPLLEGDLAPGRYEEIEREQVRQQDGLLEHALSEARQAGLEPVSALAAAGEPAAEIARAAKEQGVDLIVIGTHGRGAVGTLLMGSVAQRVVNLAEVPVVLVK